MTTDAPAQADCRAIRIDYVTLSFPRAHIHLAEAWVTQRFGRPESGSPRFLLGTSLKWAEGGCVLAFDPDSDNAKPHAVLTISGEPCKHLGDKQILALFAQVKQWGGHATRGDLAVDFFGQGKGLIQKIHDSCEAGELTRCKTYTDPLRNKRSGEIVSESIYMGKRGNHGSGRFINVYDKGLQTKQMPRGEWVRWETRYYDECADQALQRYADLDQPGRILLAFDAVEFRENNGQAHINRRPLCTWWKELRQSTDKAEIIRRSRADTTAAGFVRWIGESVAPNLQYLREKLGLSWDDLMNGMIGEVDTTRKDVREHITELLELLLSDFIDDDGLEHDSIYSSLWRRTVAGYDTDAPEEVR